MVSAMTGQGSSSPAGSGQEHPHKAQTPQAAPARPPHDSSARPAPPEGVPPRITPPPGYQPSFYPKQWPQRRAYGALDLGTNNCRLLIAKPAGDGFVVIDAFSRIVRLGEGLSATGKLSDASIDRALAALSICADKLRRRHVALARSVATEACRQASNGAAFIERVRKETGIMLDIIRPEEEARLAVLGCHALLEPGEGPALIFDIGGGSTELVLVDTHGPVPEILDWMSAPWGVVSLSETEDNDAPDEARRADAYARMKARVADSFASFANRLPKTGATTPRLLGTSGTVTTLASLYLDLPSYDRSRIDGLIVPTREMLAVGERLSRMSLNERRGLPTIGADRCELVVAGCAILEAITDIWSSPRIGVADRGIREGILRLLIASDGKKT